MSQALFIRVRFPRDAYSGGELGDPEPLPSPARLHAAFVSAAGGGPDATIDGRILVADPRHEAAVRWLEEHEPLGVIAPQTRLTEYSARRYRVRVAIDPTKRDWHRDGTSFEPFSALSGPVTYCWPAPDATVGDALAELAREITHVGRADSTAIVEVRDGELDNRAIGWHVLSSGRDAGLDLAVAEPGRFDALVDAHRRASATGGHVAGAKSPQALDEPTESVGNASTRRRRFAAVQPDAGGWAFAETWRVPTFGVWPAQALRPCGRVATATAVHRALVNAIRDDVPSFITGRDGDGPLGGAGHLAIQFAARTDRVRPELVLGLPPGVPDADRATLLDALGQTPEVRVRGKRVGLGLPAIGSGSQFWTTGSALYASEVPIILDTPGTPRHAEWTLDDALICSVGYALRGPLEADGVEWGTGWAFRRTLVDEVRQRGVVARAFRVHRGATQFVHRAREGDLIVAVHALVQLSDLARGGRGFLALGRSRHLGGGLMRPLAE